MTTLPNDPTQKFIVENTKIAENGDRTMTQKDYLTYMEREHQLSEATLKAVSVAEKAFVSGAIAIAAQDLAEKITKARKDGLDPTGIPELESVVKTSRPGGQLSTTVKAARTNTNPRNGEKTTTHGVVVVKMRTANLIDPGAAENARGMIARILGE